MIYWRCKALHCIKNRRNPALNIKSVAKKAGVSVATVSRVLNHPDAVAPDTKEHILSVMESLDYKPNWMARGLKLNRTGAIALLIPEITDLGYIWRLQKAWKTLRIRKIINYYALRHGR
jgi:DNA-binding LacI/PurR family transcriptional regulator